MSDALEPTAARLLVDRLIAEGVPRVFGVPGESYLAILDALHDEVARLPFIACRHEAAAANMAEATGKLSGLPGVAMVTRGPGTTHATIGLHTAHQDSTPMLLLIGQAARGMLDREAFQEIDYRRFLSEVTKWTGEVADAARMDEYLHRAFRTALAGRQGPVALALPEDMLKDRAARTEMLCSPPASPHPAPEDVRKTAAALRSTRRPLIVIGGGPWQATEADALRIMAESHGLPIAASFRAQSLIDNDSPAYAGHLGFGPNPMLVARLREADLVLAIGPRLGEVTTAGYSHLRPPVPAQRLIHVHAGAEELGRVYAAERLVLAAPGAFAAALAAEMGRGPVRGPHAAHEEETAFRKPVRNPGRLQLGEVFATMRRMLPDDAIVANGAGNYAAFLHRFFVYKGFRTQLAPTSGAMGYGVPAGIAAALHRPEMPTVAVAGDGCFLMSAQELATAVRHDARMIFLVVNNGMYGTIRMHQERDYPGRISGTDLVNPDFVAFARSFGLPAERVEETEDFEPAFARALESGGPALIELRPDPDAISPTTSLTKLAARAAS